MISLLKEIGVATVFVMFLQLDFVSDGGVCGDQGELPCFPARIILSWNLAKRNLEWAAVAAAM